MFKSNCELILKQIVHYKEISAQKLQQMPNLKQIQYKASNKEKFKHIFDIKQIQQISFIIHSMLNDFPKVKDYSEQRESLAFELTQQLINFRGPYSDLQIKNFEHVLWFIQFGWKLPDKKFYREERKSNKAKKNIAKVSPVSVVSGVQNSQNLQNKPQQNSKKNETFQYSNPEDIHYAALRKQCLKQIQNGQIVLPKLLKQPNYDFAIGQKIKYRERKQYRDVRMWYNKQRFDNCTERPQLQTSWKSMRKEIKQKWQRNGIKPYRKRAKTHMKKNRYEGMDIE